jgi:hypothetical protein
MVPLALSRHHSTRRRTATFALVTAFFLAGCSSTPGRVLVPELSAESGNVVEGSLPGRTGAYLAVADAASRIEVRTAALPGLLYRIMTPAGSGLKPAVTGAAGQVHLRLLPTGDDGPDEVTIVLNQAVRWDIRLPAGAGEQDLDLSRGRITRLDLGAAGLVTATLPRPDGTVPITFTDATGSIFIVTAGDTAVQIRLRRGADRVSLPWTSRPGRLLTSPGWSTTPDRYAIDTRASVATLTVR